VGESMHMNDPARENPSSGTPVAGRASTAAAAIECPQCGTQLRLLRPATIHTPIACCICGASFYLQPIETAPLSEAAIAPRRPINGQGRPAFRIVSPPRRGPGDRGPRAPGDPPPTMSTPAPPAPGPGTRSAPGMPRPVDLPDHLQRNFRTRWMESVLGAVLVLLLVVAACAGAFVLFKTIWKDRPAATNSSDGPDASDTPADDTKSATPAIGDPKTGNHPASSPTSAGVLAKALPRPESLTGAWESRVDDGSYSSFVFRSDGTVDIAQAGDPPPPPKSYHWSLVDQKGDELILDVGAELGAMGNTRMTIRVAAPDAFTLVKSICHGLVQPGGDLRYIRTGPATAAPTPLPATPPGQTPAAGPPAPSP
jgi:hypothetical protein